ncbi:hypothetical protein [Pseudoalteromonas sp. MMG005]|nr:hypothetical protein [Pseudoalteromonas sp. MMG005]MBQ4844488.1 hypothetical protein [Pseudoalteromonas sp. MMG005]
MKSISKLTLYLICIIFSQCALSNYSQPLYNDMVVWFKVPTAIAPWQFQQVESQSALLATSTKEGGGHVYFNPINQRCVVSVPHQFYDTGTLMIGKHIYTHLCQVMLSNSHQRYVDSPDKYPMDFSKRPYNIHNAALVAYQTHNPSARIFQIHGFSNKKRRSKIAKHADIIVSQGKTSDLTGQQLTTCFTSIGFIAYLYGTSVKELGGTKNIVHKLGLKPRSFMHIELSKVTRVRLRQDQPLLRKFTSCLSRTL